MFRIYESVNDSASNTMVVAYYDKAAVDADGKTLQHFLQLPTHHQDSNFENFHPEYVSVASYSEVIGWIKSTSDTRSICSLIVIP